MIPGCRFKEMMMTGFLAAGVLHSGSAAASSVMMGESGSSGHGESDYSTAPGFTDSGQDQTSDSVRMALLSVTSGQSSGDSASNIYSGDVSEKFVVRDSGKGGDQHSPYEIEGGDDDNGKSGQVIQSLPAVPLPATAWLMLSGMGGLLVAFRKRVSTAS